MRRYHLTLNTKNINYTDVLPGNCGSHIVSNTLNSDKPKFPNFQRKTEITKTRRENEESNVFS
jgi:hypothetical protein